MRKIFLILCVILLASMYNIVEAAPSFPGKVEVAGKSLILNGLGMRYATFFKVKVYKAALYLEKKEKNADKIVASSGSKKLDLHFLREVEAEKIKNGWAEGFKNNKIDTKRFQSQIKQLMDSMETMKKGQTMTFVFTGNQVEIIISKKSKAKIKSAEFSHKLLLLWLGTPPNDELKEGLLGKEEA